MWIDAAMIKEVTTPACGAHPKEIQARLGHASITTTLDRYGHLFPSLGSQLDESLELAFMEARWSAGSKRRK
jgi:integrase